MPSLLWQNEVLFPLFSHSVRFVRIFRTYFILSACLRGNKWIIQIRTGKGYLGLAVTKEWATTTCISQRLQGGSGVEALCNGKREISRGVLIGGCWPGEAGGGLPGSRESWVIGSGCMFGLLCLVGRWKRRQEKIRELSDMNQILATWGQSLQGFLFGFLDWQPEIVVWPPTSLNYR